ncbi:hypothetical protein [Accumulibacter sp.]|uniref:hypothetical protein n=1 Tax=Accumulibacter sp. TaxID=2053492 RepID=UPI0025E513BB|nr:hypothetical protein [Accumulibacter sp.]MCM8594095.1 hypothetical protein [Accumulibacter sp.]MCM8624504.1 hypothetical protein [Accumulibacter sp.]MDS4048238.1 hypothetical protein [Accumulibacter sp.]
MKPAALLLLACLTACTCLETRPAKVTSVYPPGSINADKPVTATPSPTKDEAVKSPELKVGQSWTYRRIDLWRNEETERFRQSLLFEESGRWMVRWTILDSDDAVRRGSITGERFDPRHHGFADARVKGEYAPLSFPLSIGKTWKLDFEVTANGRNTRIEQTAHVVGWESVNVPAGQFMALRVDHAGRYYASEGGYNWSGTVKESYWYVPAVSRAVRHDYADTRANGAISDQWRDELVDFAP